MTGYFSDLSFVCFGKRTNSTNVIRDRYFDGYYGIQFIRSGGFCMECGDEVWKSSGPLCFITAPELKYTYYSPHGAEHLYACFKGERVERYLAGGMIPKPAKKIIITEVEEFSDVMENLVRCLRRHTSNAHADAVLLLEKSLVLALNQPVSRQQSVYIKELVDAIAESPQSEWDFGKEAEKLNISEVHFRRIFQRETGVPPRQFVLIHRIRTAADMLRNSSMRIKEIAYLCGFGGEFYFSRQFGKVMNVSPSEYRKQFSYISRSLKK